MQLRPTLLTPEAAKLIGYSVSTLENWRSLGIGPAWSKLPSGRVVYLEQDLAEWASSGYVAPAKKV